MKYRELNDYELINQVSENEEATEILFEKYKPLIINIAKKLYQKNNSVGLELADLVQEGMVGFSVAINTFKEHKDTLFFTYARKCIESKMLALLRTTNTQKHRVLNNSVSMESTSDNQICRSLEATIGDFEANPENIVVDNENVIELMECLNQELTNLESQVFELRKSGFTYREIAQILDLEPKKVDNALQRIKQKTRNYLETKKNT